MRKKSIGGVAIYSTGYRTPLLSRLLLKWKRIEWRKVEFTLNASFLVLLVLLVPYVFGWAHGLGMCGY